MNHRVQEPVNTEITCSATVIGEYVKKALEFKITRKVIEVLKNVMTQIPQAQQIIPAEQKTVKENDDNSISYEFEPEEDEILEDLLPKNISIQIFKAFLENAASEQGSRMTAMDSATRNAGDLVDKLTINYNRSRQASI